MWKQTKIRRPPYGKAIRSVDHQVIDGAEAAQFMQTLAEFLENPVRMLV